ncbi:MAG: hypothetical protein R2991_11675 [Thermoanaerobaculia bacterium]
MSYRPPLAVAVSPSPSSPASPAPAPRRAQQHRILGTYVLASRTFPDGTVVHPPAVEGFLTYTEQQRNFNVVWQNEDGTRTSISYLAGYTLPEGTYCEQPILWVQQNLLGTPGLSTEVPAAKRDACGPVTVSRDTVTVDVPGEPVTLVFDADGITADADGMFVDRWTRVP